MTAHEDGDDLIDHALTLVWAEGLYAAFHDAPARDGGVDEVSNR